MSGDTKARLGWITAGIGIPLATVLTWVFTAGDLVAQVKTNTANVGSQQVRLERHELQLAKIEVQYDNIQRALDRLERKLQ